MSEAITNALQAACNYIDALGGVSAGYRTALSQPAPSPQPAVPVDELPDLNPEDVVVAVVFKQLGGFAPVTAHGVRVTHKPSRISVVVDSERSQHRNRQLALEALRTLIHRQAHPAPVDERKAFENCALMAGSLFKRRADDPDKYWDGNVQDDWELWQARAALQSPQPSVPVVSDEQIESCALAAGFSIEPSTGAIWAVDGCGSTRVDPGLRKFARAILTLRPTVDPMTPEQMRKAAMDEMGKIPALANHHSWKGWPGTWAFATAAVNGITAKAEGGA